MFAKFIGRRGVTILEHHRFKIGAATPSARADRASVRGPIGLHHCRALKHVLGQISPDPANL